MLKISMNRIDELFALIEKQERLYIPGGAGKQVHYDVWSEDRRVMLDPAERVDYDRWSEEQLIRLDVLNTATSVKDLFFPQTEDIASFRREGKEISIDPEAPPDEKFAVFGVRPCDARSLEILDEVFLTGPVDTYYEARRENGTVIVLGCNKPDEKCFCSAFGIDATAPIGDIFTWMVEGDLYWQVATDKGRTLTESLGGMFEEADEAAMDDSKAAVKEIFKKLKFADLDLSAFKGGDKTEAFFDSPKWEELSQSCIGCGTCTFVCPTCQCYDIRDFDTGKAVQRYRCWDSCMYSDFTMMAHGNPRKSQMERFRQRFMHKLVYFPANHEGQFSCVGCGRCLAKCPISMNIVKVAKALGEEAGHE